MMQICTCIKDQCAIHGDPPKVETVTASTFTGDWTQIKLPEHGKKPHKCPVCEGRGKVPAVWDAEVSVGKDCHGCDGKGWVVV